MASSTDCLGPIARTAEDAALVLDIISGRDARDGTSIERDSASYTELHEQIAGKKFGVIKQYMAEGVDDAVRSAVLAAIDTITASGGEIVDIDLPDLELALACYYIIVPAEISSNLGRYDGVRYGLSSEGADLTSVYEQTREEGFNAENKRRILIGTFVTSSGYHDAYYLKAQTLRAKLIAQFDSAFSDVDFLIGPIAPTPAFKLGQLTEDPLKMYLIDIMTVAANLVGVPSISIPLPVEGLPIGLQIMAPQKADRKLLAIAHALEEKFV
jgi:aspartyl-tRNA(Asn)/glutamyl-tRNA(Gln) amidotransferase subunit A